MNKIGINLEVLLGREIRSIEADDALLSFKDAPSRVLYQELENGKYLYRVYGEYLGGMQQPADPTIEGDFEIKIKNDVEAQQEINDAVCDIAMALTGKNIIIESEEGIRAHILRSWTRDKVIRFAKHLLGDECQNKIYCPKV